MSSRRSCSVLERPPRSEYDSCGVTKVGCQLSDDGDGEAEDGGDRADEEDAAVRYFLRFFGLMDDRAEVV